MKKDEKDKKLDITQNYVALKQQRQKNLRKN